MVALTGEHDLATVPELKRALTFAVESGDSVIVDLRRATFADSAVLGAIMATNKQAGPRRFAVILPQLGEVSRLFELVDARAVLVTFPSLRVALDWCYPSSPADRSAASAGVE